MAYPRRFYRRLYRRYYRRKYGSYAKTRMTRNFKSSALNMTQGGTFNVSVNIPKHLALTKTDNTAYGHEPLNIPAIITSSDMHKYLSNVFDQYRVEKVTIRIRPCGDSAPASLKNPLVIFTCIDRSGFAGNVDITKLRTYGSYKETQVSGSQDISPVHNCYIGASNLVEFTTYYDSKSMVSFPKLEWGAYSSYVVGAAPTIYCSIEVDAQVRYRGVRLDTSDVSTRIELPYISNLLVKGDQAAANLYQVPKVGWNQSNPPEGQDYITVTLNPGDSIIIIASAGGGSASISCGYNPGDVATTVGVNRGAVYLVLAAANFPNVKNLILMHQEGDQDSALLAVRMDPLHAGENDWIEGILWNDGIHFAGINIPQ